VGYSFDLAVGLFGGVVTVIDWGVLLDVSLFYVYLLIGIEKEGDGRGLTLESHGAQCRDLAKQFQTV
ncbi:tRNA (adenosine(37)-N6)-threonylcarbamoyltransferase complex ATPase subunit type 1 TsaE, partial [Streptococcus suis]